MRPNPNSSSVTKLNVTDFIAISLIANMEDDVDEDMADDWWCGDDVDSIHDIANDVLDYMAIDDVQMCTNKFQWSQFGCCCGGKSVALLIWGHAFESPPRHVFHF